MGDKELPLKSRQLLCTMNRREQDVTTKDLIQESDLSNDTVGHHMSRLMEEGFVEKIRVEDVGASHEATVYAITSAGERHADEHLNEVKQAARLEEVDNSTVHELREEVAQLWRALDSTRDRVDELDGQQERLEDVEERLDSHRDAISNLMERL